MQPKQQQGGDSVRWQAPEYVAHSHPFGWYFLLLLATAALAGLTYLISRDIFGIIVIGLLGVVVAIAAARHPRTMNYELSDSTLAIGDKNYSLKLFKSFTTSNEGELDSATLLPLKRFMLPVAIYFMPDESHEVLDKLVEIIPHDEKLPDAVDRLARRLRF